MRHAYHQKGIVYKDGIGSEFHFLAYRTPGPRRQFSCHFNAEEVVELFTHLIENKQVASLRDAYCRRGEAHLYQGATDLALGDFDEALDGNTKMPEAYHGRANAYRQQGSADRAMAGLEEALSLNPGLAAALIDRGNLHWECGSPEKAIRDFDAAVALLSTRAYGGGDLIGRGDGHLYRAIARCARRDWVGARSDLEAARQEGVLVASSFRKICGGVPRFEADQDLRMPSVVATMLYVA